jgi:hypothetical protein
MDPLTIGLLLVGLYVLFNQSSSGQSALATALSKLTTPAAPKSSGGGAGSSPSSLGSALAQAAKAAAASGTTTPQATINQLAADGNPQDGQVAAYLQALNEGNTTLADAIIGDVAPVDLESDPNAAADPTYIAPVDTPTYITPEATYDPSTDSQDTSSSSDYTDYGDGGDTGE